MYIVPKQPTSSKKETVYFVAGFMLQDIIAAGSRRHAEMLARWNQQQIHAHYKFCLREWPKPLSSFVRQSVKLSYKAGGLFGSSKAMGEFIGDLRDCLSKNALVIFDEYRSGG
jgi:hypothetical protein